MTVAAIDAATAPVTSSVGTGTGSRGRRATAGSTIAPTRAVKVTANTANPGTAAPAAATAAVRTTSTGRPPDDGSDSVARTQLSANRQRSARPRTSAISATIALPHSRRRSGNAATAAASSRPGRSDAIQDRHRRNPKRAAAPICTSATHSSGGTASCATAVGGAGRWSAIARAAA